MALFQRLIVSLLLVVLMLVGAGSVAGAKRSVDGCPVGQGYELTTLAELNDQFPGAGDYAQSKDNNADGLICVKYQTYPPAAPYTTHIAFVDNAG